MNTDCIEEHTVTRTVSHSMPYNTLPANYTTALSQLIIICRIAASRM